MSIKITNKGFTLVEMMVVVLVILLITSVITAGLNTMGKKSKDAKRISDINEIQSGLSKYFERCGMFPIGNFLLSEAMSDGCPSGINVGTFIKRIPLDPSGSTYDYFSNGNTYVLRATLKYKDDALKNDLSDNELGVGCTSGSAGYYYCVGPK